LVPPCLSSCPAAARSSFVRVLLLSVNFFVMFPQFGFGIELLVTFFANVVVQFV